MLFPHYSPQTPEEVLAYSKAAQDMFNAIGRGIVTTAKFVARPVTSRMNKPQAPTTPNP